MIKTILWDFDGVILNSMEVRDLGFEKIFNDYSEKQIKKLLEYHRENGGLSRYVKIRYFFEKILNKNITEKEVLFFAEKFSEIMRVELVKTKYLIEDSCNFIKKNYKKYNFHIVSGSDQNELRFLCKELNISSYFLTIEGSPTPKKQLVKNILSKNKYSLGETCLIGDSINDYEAAKINNIFFLAYNNVGLNKYNDIKQFY